MIGNGDNLEIGLAGQLGSGSKDGKRTSKKFDDVIRILEKTLKLTNVERAEIGQYLLNRLFLIEQHSDFLDYERKAIECAEIVFRHDEEKKRWTRDEKKVVRLGTLASDIGKTGPAGINEDVQISFLKVFCIERVPVEDHVLDLRKFINKYFNSSEAEGIIENLEGSVNLNISVREFWDLHSQWTYEIVIPEDGVKVFPEECIPAAVAHHLIDKRPGIKRVTDSLYKLEGGFLKYGKNFSLCKKYGRAEKLVMLLDIYDAYRRRGGLNHDQAISRLLEVKLNGSILENDKETKELLESMKKSLANVSYSEKER